MAKRVFAGNMMIGAKIVEQLVNAVVDAGGKEEDVRKLETNSGLRKKVAELIAGVKQSVDGVLRVFVNYDRSVESGIQAGKYNWRNDNITDKNFHPEKGESGSKEVSFELVHLNKVVSSNEALQELESRNLRPATLRELLAFGEIYPDEQRKYPIVALGSVWRRLNGFRHVPYLWCDGDERSLGLDWCGYDWYSFYRFLAVRK